MGNDKLLLSMMVGACVFLLIGIGATVVEVMGYTGEVQVPTAAPAAAGTGQTQQQQGTGQQAAGGGGGAAPKVQLLAQAPQNAVGVATVNVARLRSLGFGQAQQQGGMASQMFQPEAPISKEKLEQVVALALSDPQNPNAAPVTTAVVRHSASTSEVTSSLQQQGTAGQAVQGMDTYELQQQQGMVAIADDQTLLVADDTAGLEQIASLYSQQQDALNQLFQQEGSAIKFEAKVTDQMRSQMTQKSGQMMPGWGKTLVQEMNHVAGELDMSQQGVNFATALTMSGEQAAGEMADQLNQKLTETKDKLMQMLKNQVQSMQNMGGTGAQAQQQMQQMQSALDTLPGAFDKINIGAQGSDLSINADFTTPEIQSLGQAAMMLMMQSMFQQGFGGGGQGGLGGGGGMPGAP